MDKSDRTLAVAVAGIAATALVGIAGTTATWLSARDDRAAQRELARDERTYERRVAAYLDAMDLFETEKAALGRLADIMQLCREDICGEVPYPAIPTDLEARLHAFGSARVNADFEKMVDEGLDVSDIIVSETRTTDDTKYSITANQLTGDFFTDYREFAKHIRRFEESVHSEIG